MNIPSFQEILDEMAIAGYGDWTPSKEMVGYKTSFIVKNKWKFIDYIKDRFNNKYKLYNYPNTYDYILGKFKKTSTNEEVFEVVTSIKLNKRKDIKYNFKYEKEVFNVDGVQVNYSLQGNGLALSLYTYLVKKQNMYILGDGLQYFGARRLWRRLSKRTDLTVDIINIDRDEIIEEDVLLHLGDTNDEFDKRVWTNDYSDEYKKNIRLVLKNIKDIRNTN